MASKKTSAPAATETATPAPADPMKAAIAATKAKHPDMVKRGIELVAAATLRKLTRDEVTELRGLKLKKDGSALVAKSGKRTVAPVNAVSIANAVDLYREDGKSIEAVTKMHARYGAAMKRPYAAFVKSLPEGDDKQAFVTLGRTLFPSGRKGFAKKDSQTVSKAGRAAIDVRVAGISPRAEVKNEVITLADGRRGVFTWAPAAAPVAPQAAPVLPFGAAPASPAA